MPRTLKRRSDAISRDVSPPASSPEPEPSQHQQARSQSPSSVASDNSDEDATQNSQQASVATLTKKLIRLALACEYARLPLRRSDITQKIFKEANASHRLFKPVFANTQKTLASVFGMQLTELPTKEKTSLRDRRTQATQAATQNSKSQNGANAGATSNKSWILTSTLPDNYKTNPNILQPVLAPTISTESTYTALYTFIVSLIQLSPSQSLSESKLERFLKRVNADTYTPAGTLDKLLSRMAKEGYIEKRKDVNLGEESVEYVVGPRGKIEIGVSGTAGLVRTVYGFGTVSLGVDESSTGRNNGNGSGSEDDDGEEGQERDTEPRRIVKMEKDELEKRLVRSLGDEVKLGVVRTGVDVMQVDERTEEVNERPRVRRKTRRGRNDEEDDQEEEVDGNEDDDDE